MQTRRLAFRSGCGGAVEFPRRRVEFPRQRGRVPQAARAGGGVEFRRRSSNCPGAFPFRDLGRRSRGRGSPHRPTIPVTRVRSSSSMRNGGGNGSASTDSLDHLQRASSMARQRQQRQQRPRPRRVIHTTPFGLWDSFPEARTLDQMVRTMERLMDGDDADTNGRFGVVVPAAAPTAVPRADSGRRGRTPWEVRERVGEYLVRFDMPGMARDDVRVSVQDRTLVVVAEKQQRPAAAGGVEKQEAAAGGGYEEGDEEEEAWPAASFGRYRTRVELPENVDVERIAAEVRDGVLYLTIPKLSAGGKVVNVQVH